MSRRSASSAAGSLRRQSYNHDVPRAAIQLAPEGASIDIVEIVKG